MALTNFGALIKEKEENSLQKTELELFTRMHVFLKELTLKMLFILSFI